MRPIIKYNNDSTACYLQTKQLKKKLRIEKKILNDLVTNIGEFNKINLKVIND